MFSFLIYLIFPIDAAHSLSSAVWSTQDNGSGDYPSDDDLYVDHPPLSRGVPAPPLPTKTVPAAEAHGTPYQYVPPTAPPRALAAPVPAPRHAPPLPASTVEVTVTAPPSQTPRAKPLPEWKRKRQESGDIVPRPRPNATLANTAVLQPPPLAPPLDEDENEEDEPPAKKQKGRKSGTQNFNENNRLELVRLVEIYKPAGQLGWDKVCEDYNKLYAVPKGCATRERDRLKDKFMQVGV